MRIDRWLQLRRTKAFCIGLAVLFGAEQAWGADPSALYALKLSGEQQRQAEQALSAAVVTIYDDLYSRRPTAEELKQALEFLRRSPQLAHLMERLSASPESRWRLRQINPERVARRKAEAARIADAVSRMVGDFLRSLADGSSGRPIEITVGLTVEPDPAVLARLDEPAIGSIASWLREPETLCSNCAPNALAPMLGQVGISVSRETLTAQAFLADYLTGHLREECQKNSIDYRLLSTSTPLDHALASYLSWRE